MAEQKPIISIDHVSMRFNLAKEKHESLKEYFVALLHGGVRFDEFFALDDVSFDIMPGDFYGQVAALMHRRKIPVVLDSSGPGLKGGLQEGRIFLVKPSIGELRQFTGQ